MHAPEAARLVGRLRAYLGRDVHIVVGGAAFAAVPRFANELGCDGHAHDLVAAAALLRRAAAR